MKCIAGSSIGAAAVKPKLPGKRKTWAVWTLAEKGHQVLPEIYHECCFYSIFIDCHISSLAEDFCALFHCLTNLLSLPQHLMRN